MHVSNLDNKCYTCINVLYVFPTCNILFIAPSLPSEVANCRPTLECVESLPPSSLNAKRQ